MGYKAILSFFIAILALGFVFNCSLAYDFREDSGLDGTAQATGHLEAGITADNQGSLARVIGSFIKIALSFVGIIFFVLMIYGGFIWMTARGNDQQVEKAKSIIINSVIGLIIILSAYAITSLVIDNSQPTGNPAGDDAAFEDCQPPHCVWQDGGPVYIDF